MAFFDMIEVIALGVLWLFSLYGCWLYYRAVRAYPGEVLKPLGHWLVWVVALADCGSLLLIPVVLANWKGDTQGASFFAAYYIGRMLVPTIVPPGPELVVKGFWSKIRDDIRDFVFDHIAIKVAALIFAVIFPWVMGGIFGEPRALHEYIIAAAVTLPFPPLPPEYFKASLSMSLWFYVGLMMWMPLRLGVQLRPLLGILAATFGILSFVRLDLATSAPIDVAGNIWIQLEDVVLFLAGLLLSRFVDLVVKKSARRSPQLATRS